MKSFIEYLSESYKDLSDIKFNDRYDKEFGIYAMNEIPLYWDKKERNECKNLYGGVNVGVVYYGGKIQTEEALEHLKKLKSGDTYRCFLISTSNSETIARSFMDYTKSYNELVMLSTLNNSITTGSSGKYGSFLLTLEPTPDQVILTNFKKTKRKLSIGAEEECILYGDVKIKNIYIREPLNLDNYENIIFNDFPEIMKSSFIETWLKSHKLDLKKEFAQKLLTKIKSFSDVYIFFSNYEISPYILHSLKYEDLIKNKFLKLSLQKKYITVAKTTLYINIPKFEPIKLPQSNDLNKIMVDIMKSDLILSASNTIETLSKKNYICKLSDNNELYIDNNGTEILMYLIYLHNNNKNINHPIINQIVDIYNELEKRLKEKILNKKIDDYENKNELEIIENLFLSSIKLKGKYGIFIKTKSNFINDCFNWYYNSFSKRIKNNKLLAIYMKSIQNIMNELVKY